MTKRRHYRSIFEAGDSIGTPMLVALMDDLGSVEFFDWEPESLRMEIQDRYDAKLPPENMDKLQALIMALTTNQFYVSLEAFINICNALAGEGSDFESFDPADVDEMAWAVAEVLLLDPPEDGDATSLFSQEVRHYIAEKAKDEGFIRLPRPLNKLAGDLLSSDVGEMAPETDAALAAASIQTQDADIKGIEDYIQKRVAAMMETISNMRLANGDVESWSKYSKRTPTWGERQKKDILGDILD
jgi:hypothetical protein